MLQDMHRYNMKLTNKKFLLYYADEHSENPGEIRISILGEPKDVPASGALNDREMKVMETMMKKITSLILES